VSHSITEVLRKLTIAEMMEPNGNGAAKAVSRELVSLV
jgi:hypothetical protein